jgi:hypothetical protein
MTKNIGCLNFYDPVLRRRDFLRVGSLSLLGISLSQFLRLEKNLVLGSSNARTKAQSCILLWLEGGPSQVDTWDPKNNSSFRPISTNVPGIQISELLPKVAKRMDKLAIIRSMHTLENNHPQATHYAATGHQPNPAMRFPSLGSVVAKELVSRNNVPPYVLTPSTGNDTFMLDHFGAAFIGNQYDPMALPDPSSKNFKVPDLRLPKTVTAERLQDRLSFRRVVEQIYRNKIEEMELSGMDIFTEQALNMILTPSVQKAFDVSTETTKTKEAYGLDSFGQSVLLARRLVEAGSRFVTAAGYKYNEWDTHSDNDKRHKDHLVPTFDRTFSVLLDDLDQRGLLESTIVIAMGEFGRGPSINPGNGRDHWPQCWSLVLGGGGIRGGQVVGSSDEQGGYVVDRVITIGDLFATIYKALGIDWEKTYMTPIGRPIKIANSLGDATGIPIKEII